MPLCARGDRCLERDETNRPTWTDNPLCVSDERKVRQALSELPDLYTEIAGTVHSVGGTVGTEPVSGAHDPRRVPMRLEHDVWVRATDLAVQAWDEAVGDAERLSRPSGHWSTPQALQRLTAHLSAFLRLPALTMTRWVPEFRVAELDDDVMRRITASGDAIVWEDFTGPEGAFELVGLARRGRMLIGEASDVERMSAPCPSCDLLCLTRRGAWAHCGACGDAFNAAEVFTWAVGSDVA